VLNSESFAIVQRSSVAPWSSSIKDTTNVVRDGSCNLHFDGSCGFWDVGKPDVIWVIFEMLDFLLSFVCHSSCRHSDD
jgi:hypothetical protein